MPYAEVVEEESSRYRWWIWKGTLCTSFEFGGNSAEFSAQWVGYLQKPSIFSALGQIRTADLRFRKPSLCPY